MGSVWCGPASARNVGTKSQSRKCVLEDAAKVTQLGTDGRWQQKSPNKEELELLRHSTDLRFGGSLLRKAQSAGKSGDWEKFLENDRLSAHGQA